MSVFRHKDLFKNQLSFILKYIYYALQMPRAFMDGLKALKQEKLNKVKSQEGSSKPIQNLLYNLHHAPSKVSKIEDQFCDKLEANILSKNKQLLEDDMGPSVVFVINSSRIGADIQRELKSGNI